MIKNHKFLYLFAITLCAALLLSMGSKATRVFALADPVQAISPIYDTQIYQLKDYIDNGGLSSGQLDIFYTLAGFYVLGQAGSTGYKLVDPYSNTDSVWEWLKSCGIEMYNTVIGLIPDTARMPITGDIYSTIPFKKASQIYVATLMGAAVKAATFPDYNTFKQEVINSDSYFLPWNLDVQKGMNSIFGIYDGIYDWQFTENDWTSNFSWHENTLSSSQQLTYTSLYNQLDKPTVQSNPQYVAYASNLNISYFGKFDLFINTYNSTAYFVDSSGNIPNDLHTSGVIFRPDWRSVFSSNVTIYFRTYNYSSLSFNNLMELAQQILNSATTGSNPTLINAYFSEGSNWTSPDYGSVVNKIYAGTNWLNKTEIHNLTNLNIDDSEQGYYEAVPEGNDYLLDIKGILQDILNNTNLFNTFINNLVDINGVPVHDDDLIRITTNIYDLLEQTNPVLPVNLNDVSDYMDNTYLDLVKEHGQNFGETIGEYVAFWHNSDPEITYVIFGALILTLVGAFIGKWGHS